MFTAMVVAVIVVLAVLGYVVFGSGSFRATTDAAALSRRLLETGTPAPARILEVHDTYTRVSANPLVRFRLEVQPKNAAPYETTTETVVSVVDLPRFQPGATVEVRIDPKDRARVAVVVR